MNKPEVIVFIKGGIVNSICTSEDMDVCILDMDCESIDEEHIYNLKTSYNSLFKCTVDFSASYTCKEYIDDLFNQIDKQDESKEIK